DPGISVVAEAANGNEVLEVARSQSVDVVVVDITMPGKSGLDTLKELKKLQPRLPVIVLSMHPSDQYAVRVLRAGAAGYLTKESAPGELVKAIKKAYRGDKYISEEVAELLAGYIQNSGDEDPHKKLSDREYEVLVSLGSGKSVSQTSAEMFLSVKTVSTYRSRIIEKTGLQSNAEMTRYCIERKLY
ncbi:MAG: response regulator transcription factor, partial [Deltaproteobacteria bacterium]|nr:response regulator transcription factor [Deltaproteobacteria bacterium]